MASSPHKVVRFLVWASTSRDHRDDALIALDDGFANAKEKFGPVLAHLWAYSQGIRSLPYGLVALIIKISNVIWRMGG